MSELQQETDDFIIDEGVEAPEPSEEAGAELAPATEGQDKAQDAVQAAINRQHAKYREEERKRIALEKELEEARKELESAKASKGIIEVPPIPDAWDEDFDEKIAARDKALLRKAEQDALFKAEEAKQSAARKSAEQAEQERMAKLVGDYDKRIVKLGLDAGEVRRAVDTVVSYGISNDLGEFLLGDADGPLITKYLADNPLELDELRGMSPITAALRINSTIRAAASVLKPQASEAPDPIEPLAGRGAGEKVSPLIKGATFT